MGKISRFLEKKIRSKLYKKRQQFIDQATYDFIIETNPTPEILELFKKRLNDEADRVYIIVDALLKARIKIANWTLIIGVLTSVVAIGVTAGLTGGTAIPIIVPVIAAVIGYLVFVYTTKYLYNERVKAGLDTVLLTIRKELKDPTEISKFKKEIAEIQNNLGLINEKLQQQQAGTPVAMDTDITAFKQAMNDLLNKMHHLDQKVDFLSNLQTPSDVFNEVGPSNDADFTTTQYLTKMLLENHQPNSPSNTFESTNQIVNKPPLYVAQQGFFQPVSANPILKAIETNQVYQLIGLLNEMQRKNSQSMLDIINNYRTSNGYGLLHYAVAFGSSDIVNFLLDAGINLNALTPQNESALDIAIKYRYKDIVIALAKRTEVPGNEYTAIRPTIAVRA